MLHIRTKKFWLGACLASLTLFFLVFIFIDIFTTTRVPILVYHRVDRSGSVLSVQPHRFEQQVRYLARHGYHTISLDTLVDHLQNGTPLPPHSIIITFDDGYADNYNNAYPVLKKYGFQATVFVITEMVGQENYMSWEQIKELADDGITIGAHSLSHPDLTSLNPDEAKKEIYESKEQIEKVLGKKVKFFAYPQGKFNDAVKQMVMESGYIAACSTEYGVNGADADVFALKRVGIHHKWVGALFALKLKLAMLMP